MNQPSGNKSGIDVAVVGATGAVGEAMIELLEERKFPVRNLYLLASERSAGKTMRVLGATHQVSDLAQFDFSQVQLGLFSPGASVSAVYAPQAAQAGCYVVDNTSHFRMREDIPLVVPEVNGEVLRNYAGRIIANPNCSTIQMLVALQPLHQAIGIERITVSTYQAVSGAGTKGIEELAGQTAALLNAREYPAKAFPQQIAFNAIPQIGDILDNGYTVEEMKMAQETCKIFGDDDIEVNPTCVRIPAFYGHAEAVSLTLRAPLTVQDAQALLTKAAGVKLMLDSNYPTPVAQGAGTDAVYVGRVRADLYDPCGINLWVVADNVRKGAALNSVQIAEYLLQNGAISVG